LGDFELHPNSIGLLSDSYYREALSQLESSEQDIFLFTNNLDIAKLRVKKWGLKNKIKIIESSQNNSPAEDLMLLSKCTHIITSNSTYSLWAAKLSCSNSIFYPKQYRKDKTTTISSIPKSWIGLDNAWQR